MGRSGPRALASPLFTLDGAPMTYAQLQRTLRWALRKVGGVDPKAYGGHSFRVGGAQALAMAGRSTPYIMAMGRWRCVELVLTYVQTPLEYRMTDASDMMTALPGGQAEQATVRTTREVVAASVALAARLRYQ